MSDEPESLILLRLREIRDIVGRVEAGYASLPLRLARIETRLDYIERRLGLIDPVIP